MCSVARHEANPGQTTSASLFDRLSLILSALHCIWWTFTAYMLCWAEGTQHAANALCKASKSVSCPLVSYIRLLEIQPANNTAEKPSKEETFSTVTSPHVKGKTAALFMPCQIFTTLCSLFSLASVPDVGVGKQNPYRRHRDSNYTTLTENIQISSQSEWNKTDTLLLTNANWQIAFAYTCSLLTSAQRSEVSSSRSMQTASSADPSLSAYRSGNHLGVFLWCSELPKFQTFGKA